MPKFDISAKKYEPICHEISLSLSLSVSLSVSLCIYIYIYIYIIHTALNYYNIFVDTSHIYKLHQLLHNKQMSAQNLKVFTAVIRGAVW
jgi:hypothetical protein